MEFDFPAFDRIPAASLDPVSFADVLRRAHPEAMPTSATSAPSAAIEDVPHGTTILAIRFQGGVVIAGDRRATEGYSIAHRSIKKRYRPDLSRDEAVKVALEALFDASEEDVATGGPDSLRKIYPNIAAISDTGVLKIDDDTIGQLFNDLLAERLAAGRVQPREHVPGED